MSGQLKPDWVELSTNILSNSQDYPASQRSPQTTQTADDNRFKSKNKTGRAIGWRKAGADAQQNTGNRYNSQRQSHCQAVNLTAVDAHQFCRIRIIGCSAKSLA